jgi:L-rhamnose mutarotase
MSTARCYGLLLAVLLLSTGCAAPRGVQFHVSPDGSDQSPGSRAQPFRTIARAREAVREEIRRGLRADVTVLIRGGTYVLDEPLVFGPGDGGTQAHAVVYAAWPGEEPVLSGGRPIRGFTETGRNEWSAPLPAGGSGSSFRQLFMDGVRQCPARFPNAPEVLRVASTSSDVKQIKFDQPIPGAGALGADAELVVLQNWCVTRVAIASSEAAAVTATVPAGWIGHGDPTTTSPGKAAWLERSPAFLDQPGEWCLDRTRGRLVYRSEDGFDPARHSFVASFLPKIVVVQGERGAPVRNLHIRGLTLADTEWSLPNSGYIGIQAGHYGTRISEPVHVLPAAVELGYAEACGLERCRILRAGASGVGLGAGCRDNRIDGCEIADVAGNGVMVGLRSDRELGGQPGNHGLMAEWTDPADVPCGNAVTNCYVHHAGVLYACCVGIYDGFCRDTLIAHNLVSHLPYTGISVGFRWDAEPTCQRGARIEYNQVCEVMGLLADGGAIYTLGWQPGTVLRGNLLTDVQRSRYSHGAPNNGIFFDQGSKGFLVEDNVIYNTSGEPIRYNQCRREDLTWGRNALGTDPRDAAFPHEAAAKAGLPAAYQSLVTSRLLVADSAGGANRVRRYGSVVGVKAAKLDEYKRLHAKAWPGVLKMIRECNIRNYSIYLAEIEPGQYYLFSYFEYVGTDMDQDMAKMKADPTTRRWWTYTDPCQFAIPTAGKGELWHTLPELFHTD